VRSVLGWLEAVEQLFGAWMGESPTVDVGWRGARETEG